MNTLAFAKIITALALLPLSLAACAGNQLDLNDPDVAALQNPPAIEPEPDSDADLDVAQDASEPDAEDDGDEMVLDDDEKSGS